MSTDLLAKLTDIFQEVFEDDDLQITRDTSAADIEEWDSLMHVALLLNVEQGFGIKFNSGDVSGLKSVGDLADLIAARQGA